MTKDETAYYDAIDKCIERYTEMADRYAHTDLLLFLKDFGRDVPLYKLNRWLGYVQCALIERHVTTVRIERDWTRPLFRPLDFPEAQL